MSAAAADVFIRQPNSAGPPLRGQRLHTVRLLFSNLQVRSSLVDFIRLVEGFRRPGSSHAAFPSAAKPPFRAVVHNTCEKTETQGLTGFASDKRPLKVVPQKVVYSCSRSHAPVPSLPNMPSGEQNSSRSSSKCQNMPSGDEVGLKMPSECQKWPSALMF